MSVLYHEILLALIGHTGDVIVQCDSENNGEAKKFAGKAAVANPRGTFAVAKDAVFVSKTERAIIDQICQHGFYYRAICQFVSENQHVEFSATSYSGSRMNASPSVNTRNYNAGYGLYLRALCIGLTEVLRDYRCLILDIEQAILAKPDISLSRIKYMLRKHTVLFPPLHSLVEEISGYNTSQTHAQDLKSNSRNIDRVPLRGGQILDLLYRRALVGIPAVRDCLNRLLFHCNRVLYNQITSFIVHGFLSDPFGEFFIQFAPTDASRVSTKVSSARGSAQNPLTQRHRVWNTKFNLRLNMLPVSYIPISVAKSILFIGYSVCLLQHPRIAGYIASIYPKPEVDDDQNFSWLSEASEKEAKETKSRKNGDQKRLVVPTPDSTKSPQFFHKSPRISTARLDGPDMGTGLIPPHDLREFERGLRRLSNAPVFESAKVVSELARVRYTVNQHMCDLVVSRGQFLRQIRVLKDFFFLTRGEFYQTFIEEGASTFFREPTFSKSSQTLAERAFLGAAQKYGIDDDPFFQRFNLYLDEPHFSFTTFAVPSVAAEVRVREVDALGRPTAAASSRTPGPHQLELLGSAKIEGKELLLGRGSLGRPGAAWFHYRRRVDTGFTSRATFVSENGPEPGGFAFAIQNHSISATGRDTSGKSGLSGISNVVAVEITTDRSCSFITVLASGNTRLSTTTESSRVGVPPPTVLARQKISKLEEKKGYVLRVDYVPGMLKVFFGRAFEKKEKPRRTVPDQDPTLQVQLSLTKVMRLENGRAWLGFTAGGQKTSRVRILDWKYKGETKNAASHAWRHLRLDYRTDPPLDLVISEDCMDRYNALFSFLFEVKRVQLALQRAWQRQQQSGRMLSKIQRQRLLRVWALRHKMQFLIDNLQYYLQVDVLDVQYSELVKKIEQSKAFEAVTAAHAVYLATLTKQCFLHARVIHRTFRRVFELCMDFCNIVTIQSQGMEDLNLRRIDQLAREFQLQLRFLVCSVEPTTGVNSSPHLTQLILRIDFNRNYKREALEQGTR